MSSTDFDAVVRRLAQDGVEEFRKHRKQVFGAHCFREASQVDIVSPASVFQIIQMCS